MWPFRNENRRTQLMDPDSYAKLLIRITERDADLATLKAKITAVELSIASINGKMSSKLRDLRKEFESEQVNTNESYINSGEVPIG